MAEDSVALAMSGESLVNMHKKIGICRICGQKKKLSFEHIPPYSLGNTLPAKLKNGEEIIKGDRFIWDIGGLKYVQRLHGIGFYSICQECNNFKGGNYDNYFKDFYTQMSNPRSLHIGGSPFYAEVEFKEIFPLRVLKYLVASLLTISNPKWTAQYSDLQHFVRDKDDLNFNIDKYHIDVYLRIGQFRAEQFCEPMLYQGYFLGYRPILVSYIDLANIGYYLMFGVSYDSMSFSRFAMQYGIDQSFSGKLRFLCVERNSLVPFDFRTQEEIVESSKGGKDLVPTQ